MQDHSTHRVYRLYDFNKSQQITPGQYYCVSGKVNSADKLYLVIESVKMDTKHCRCSTTPAPAGGAGGWLMKRSEERRVGKECRSRWSSHKWKDKRRGQGWTT